MKTNETKQRKRQDEDLLKMKERARGLARSIEFEMGHRYDAKFVSPMVGRLVACCFEIANYTTKSTAAASWRERALSVAELFANGRARDLLELCVRIQHAR